MAQDLRAAPCLVGAREEGARKQGEAGATLVADA